MNPSCDALIVDDCEADRYLLRRLLKRAGWFHTIHETGDGHRALELIRIHAEDCTDEPGGCRRLVVFLDVNMPGLSGFDVLEACEQMLPIEGGTVVILFTSSDDPSDLARARRYACVAGRVVKMPEQVDALGEQLSLSIPEGWAPTLQRTLKCP